MEITEEQYARIKDSLPVQRGNVGLSKLQLLNALLYVAEHGCKCRGLPKRFGNWHTIYTRMDSWSKNGVIDRVFEKRILQWIAEPRREINATQTRSFGQLAESSVRTRRTLCCRVRPKCAERLRTVVAYRRA